MPTPSSDALLRHVRHLAACDEAVSDRELLGRFAAERDEAAFAALVRRHGTMVFRTARRLLHEGDAEDVFQAAFLVLARKAGSVAWQESIGAWLHRVTCRLALQAHTTAARRRARESATPPRSVPDPLAEVTVREAHAAFDEELARLPERLRAPLVLCHLEGATRDEAARRLGLSLATLKRRLDRGRNLLRDRLVRRGLALSSALLAELLVQGAAPGCIVQATVRAAVLEAAGESAVGVISQGAAALAPGAAAPLGRAWSVVALLVLVGVLAAAGVGLAARRPAGEQSPSTAAPPERAAEAPKQAEKHADADGLPPGAVTRLGSVRLRHQGAVHAVVFSRDGKLLASAGDDGARLWDGATGRPLRRLEADFGTLARVTQKYAHAVALSPDGKLVAAGVGDFTVRVWDTATGKEVHKLDGLTNGVGAVAFSTDGKLLAAGSAWGEVRVWEADTGKLLNHIKDAPEKRVSRVDFTPDGKTLIAQVGHELVLRDWPGGKEKTRHTLYGPPALSSDRKRFAYGVADYARGGPLVILDLVTGKEVEKLEGHRSGCLSVALSPNGKLLASAGVDNTIRLWDVATHRELRRFEGQPDWNHVPLAFSPDGQTLVAGSQEGTIRTWDVATGKPSWPADAHALHPLAVAWSPDGRTLATLDVNGYARLWDAASGKMRKRFGGMPPGRGSLGAVDALVFAPDGKSLLVSHYRQDGMRLRDGDGKEVRRIEGQRGVYSPDGKLLAIAGVDKARKPTLELTDAATGQLHARLLVPEGMVQVMAFSPDGRTLTAGLLGVRNGLVASWDVGTGKLRGEGRPFPQGRMCVALSPDGRTAALSDLRGRLHLFDLASGQESYAVPGHGGVFSPDGRLLAAADGTVVRLWETATGLERVAFAGHERGAGAMAFAPDGRTLASTSLDGTVLVWDLTGRLKRQETEPDTKALQALWDDLGERSGSRAHRAVWALAAAGRAAVPFLRERVRPVEFDAAGLAKLIADLDSGKFATRQTAADELAHLYTLAEPALRKALADKPSLEMARRLEKILEDVQRRRPPASWLRAMRALEVLERVGTPEAREVIERVAGGAAESEITQSAKDARTRSRVKEQDQEQEKD